MSNTPICVILQKWFIVCVRELKEDQLQSKYKKKKRAASNIHVVQSRATNKQTERYGRVEKHIVNNKIKVSQYVYIFYDWQLARLAQLHANSSLHDLYEAGSVCVCVCVRVSATGLFLFQYIFNFCVPFAIYNTNFNHSIEQQEGYWEWRRSIWSKRTHTHTFNQASEMKKLQKWKGTVLIWSLDSLVVRRWLLLPFVVVVDGVFLFISVTLAYDWPVVDSR